VDHGDCAGYSFGAMPNRQRKPPHATASKSAKVPKRDPYRIGPKNLSSPPGGAGDVQGRLEDHPDVILERIGYLHLALSKLHGELGDHYYRLAQAHRDRNP